MALGLYIATFQQRYNHEDHPVIPFITGSTYLALEVESEEDARIALSLATCPVKDAAADAGDYAFLYDWIEFEPQIDKYELHESAFKIVLKSRARGTTGQFNSCGAGGYFWMRRRLSGSLKPVGCVCHNKRDELLNSVQGL